MIFPSITSERILQRLSVTRSPKRHSFILENKLRWTSIKCFPESIAYEAEISRQNIFRYLKLDFNPFLPPKHYEYDGRFSLLVGYNV